jgi:hypothetical protein
VMEGRERVAVEAEPAGSLVLEVEDLVAETQRRVAPARPALVRLHREPRDGRGVRMRRARARIGSGRRAGGTDREEQRDADETHVLPQRAWVSSNPFCIASAIVGSPAARFDL